MPTFFLQSSLSTVWQYRFSIVQVVCTQSTSNEVHHFNLISWITYVASSSPACGEEKGENLYQHNPLEAGIILALRGAASSLDGLSILPLFHSSFCKKNCCIIVTIPSFQRIFTFFKGRMQSNVKKFELWNSKKPVKVTRYHGTYLNRERYYLLDVYLKKWSS